MLATLISSGSESASTQTDRGRELAGDAPRDDLVLASVLRALQQLFAEVVVDSGVGAAPRRARESHRGHARSPAPHQQLRAGAEEDGLGRADAKAEAGGKRLTQGPEEGAWIVG